MSTEDRRRLPLLVPVAAAVAGAMAAFAVVEVFDLYGDEYVTVVSGSPAAAPGAPLQDQPVAPSRSGPATTSSGSEAPAGPASDTTISREEAGAIAAAHVRGVVDSIHTENDYGAAWDVDVYAPDGDYTIYVSATGEIVRVMGPFYWD